VLEEADDVLGYKLSRIMTDGSDQDLRPTEIAQPALLTASVASQRTLEEQLGTRLNPISVSGHSAGLYSTIVLTDVLDFPTGLNVVNKRAQLMKEASLQNPGTMGAIIGLDLSTVEGICRETGAEIANINTARQIVVSGGRKEVAQALDLAVGSRGKKVELRVSGAFHSSLMQYAREGLRGVVSDIHFNNPTVPIAANTRPEMLTKGEELKEELIKGMCEPVRWYASVERMIKGGTKAFIEVGPKDILTNMVRQIDRKMPVFQVGSVQSAAQLARQLS
jgi:[acyl-carrier-protein] S-malonyltransferase